MKINFLKYVSIVLLLLFIHGCSNDNEIIDINSESDLLEFSFKKDDNPGLSEDLVGIVNQISQTVTFSKVLNKNLIKSLKPTLVISEGATIESNNNEFQDYTNLVEYSIVSKDNTTKKVYRVSVQGEGDPNSDREVLIAIFNLNPDQKDRFDDEGWDINNPNSDISSWRGVVVEDGRVVELILTFGDSDFDFSLPSTIKSLEKLRKLEVRGRTINLPIELWSLQQLEELEFRPSISKGGEPLKIDRDILNLINLKFLGAGSLDTSSIDNLSDLNNLEFLSFRNNDIQILGGKSLPKNLKVLDVRGNALKTFSSDFGDLTSLEKLDVRGDLFEGFPSDAMSLVNLNELTISEMKNTDLPFGLSLFPNLKMINVLRCENLTNVRGVGVLSSLESLTVVDTKLKELPSEIGNLLELRYLFVFRNEIIDDLPAEIGSLVNLKVLDVNGNKISHLPAEIGNLSNLEALDLRNNPLESLPSSICSLVTQGTVIQMSNDKIDLLNICL